MGPNPEPDPDLFVSDMDSHQNVTDPQQLESGLMCPESYLSCHFVSGVDPKPIKLASGVPTLYPTSHHSAGMYVYPRVAASVASSPAGHRLNCSSTSPNLSPLSWDAYLRVAARVASSPAEHRLNCSSTSPNISPLGWDECLPESGGKCGVQSSRTSPQLLQHLTQHLATRLG
jgi:hypothetical protein